MDLYLASGAGPAPTSPAIEPSRRIDYVWGKGVQPVAGQVLDSLASDHRMVIVKVIVPAQAVQ